MFETKVIPKAIEQEVKLALSYFPQLAQTKIHFKFKKEIKHSTMQAQPALKSLLFGKSFRQYNIFISERFKISGKQFLTKQLPTDILIGWIGHELGHILDYEQRSTFNLITFGIKYLLADRYIIAAERAADQFAVAQGMEEYILKTKDFILNHAEIDHRYKSRIIKYYLSPEEIMALVNQRNLAK